MSRMNSFERWIKGKIGQMFRAYDRGTAPEAFVWWVNRIKAFNEEEAAGTKYVEEITPEALWQSVKQDIEWVIKWCISDDEQGGELLQRLMKAWQLETGDAWVESTIAIQLPNCEMFKVVLEIEQGEAIYWTLYCGKDKFLFPRTYCGIPGRRELKRLWISE